MGGHSSVGRASAWHAGGQEFESPWLHEILLLIIGNLKVRNKVETKWYWIKELVQEH